MTIKAITFDFWHTLYKSQEINHAERLRQFQIKVERGSKTAFANGEFEAAVLVARDEWNRVWIEEQRTLTADLWLDIMLNDLGIELTPDHKLIIQTDMENSVLVDAPSLVPEAHEVLSVLSKQYRLGVISDTGLTPGRVLRELMEADNMTQYFTHLTFSDEIGCSKPHPEAFSITLDALDAEPAEAVHVGDILRTDVAGAQAVGMRGVQYIGVRRDEQTDAAPPVTPDAVIKSHAELFSLLEQWSR